MPNGTKRSIKKRTDEYQLNLESRRSLATLGRVLLVEL